MRKLPIALLTGREAAKVLQITQARFARAVRTGKVPADFIGNSLDLFLPGTIKRLAARKPQLFP